MSIAVPMPALTNDDLTAFNDELAALVRAGLPLELGLGATPDEAAAALERVNLTLSRRPGGEAVSADALKHHSPPLPAAYRSLVQIGLRTGDLSGALDSANRLAELEEDSQFNMRSALVYPLLVFTLAVGGALAFAMYGVPALVNLYNDLALPWGRGLRVAAQLREWRLVVAALLAVSLATTAWQIWRTFRRSPAGAPRGAVGKLSGATCAVQQQQYATFAESMAMLTAADVPLEESLPIAAAACGDERFATGAAADKLPPFLQWALLRSEPAVERSRALRMAAEVYRDASQRTAARSVALAPALAAVLVAGGAVLGYGLLLFAPLTDLIRNLALNM